MAHFNHFDFIAPYYDRFIKPNDPARLCELLELQTAGKLLDAGGGTGRIASSLMERVKSIVIVDSSMGMLNQSRKKEGLIQACSNTEELPFVDESFERVIMVDALHHVCDYRMTLDELWRVVKPGGRIVIEEPDIGDFPIKILAMFEKLTMMRSHFIPPINIRDAFHYENASTRIEKEGTTSWIVIEKCLD